MLLLYAKFPKVRLSYHHLRCSQTRLLRKKMHWKRSFAGYAKSKPMENVMCQIGFTSSGNTGITWPWRCNFSGAISTRSVLFFSPYAKLQWHHATSCRSKIQSNQDIDQPVKVDPCRTLSSNTPRKRRQRKTRPPTIWNLGGTPRMTWWRFSNGIRFFHQKYFFCTTPSVAYVLICWTKKQEPTN